MPRGVMVRQSGPFEPLPIVRGREKLRRARAAADEFAGLGQSAFLGTSAELSVEVAQMPLHGDRKSTRLNPVTNAHLVCRLLLEQKKTTQYTSMLQLIQT